MHFKRHKNRVTSSKRKRCNAESKVACNVTDVVVVVVVIIVVVAVVVVGQLGKLEIVAFANR